MGSIAALAVVIYLKVSSSDPAPSARVDAPLIYNAQGKSLLMFGGTDTQNRNDLWRYSIPDNRWMELNPSGSLPGARFGHSTVYDPVRRRLILFGGQANGFFSDVWAYDFAANRWTQLAKDGAGPSSRYGHSAIYDQTRDRMVISHGFTTSGRFDDTWAFELTGNRWTNVTPFGNKPLKRCLHHAAYDERGDQFLLFGGCSSGFGKCPQDDLWSFDLSRQTWTQLASAPPSRERYAIAFDSKRSRLTIFGGSGFPLLNDTWVYETISKSWTSPEVRGDVPSPRSRVEGVYAEDSDSVFWFGGSTDAGLSSELFRLNLGQSPKIDSVVNTFSGLAGGVAPGELVSIFGSGLEETVTFGGMPGVVSFASPTQINTRVPEATTIGRLLTVQTGGAQITVDVVNSRPGWFPTVFNGDGSPNSDRNPIRAGDIVVLYATGVSAADVRVSIAESSAELIYAGALSCAPGVIQINVRIPDGANGVVPVTIEGGSSVPVSVSQRIAGRAEAHPGWGALGEISSHPDMPWRMLTTAYLRTVAHKT